MAAVAAVVVTNPLEQLSADVGLVVTVGDVLKFTVVVVILLQLPNVPVIVYTVVDDGVRVNVGPTPDDDGLTPVPGDHV